MKLALLVSAVLAAASSDVKQAVVNTRVRSNGVSGSDIRPVRQADQWGSSVDPSTIVLDSDPGTAQLP